MAAIIESGKWSPYVSFCACDLVKPGYLRKKLTKDRKGDNHIMRACLHINGAKSDVFLRSDARNLKAYQRPSRRKRNSSLC